MLRHFYKFRVTFNYYYSSLTVDDESLNLLAFLSFFVAKGGGGGGFELSQAFEWSQAFLVETVETGDEIMPTSSFLKVNYLIPCYQEKTRSLFLIYSLSRLELTLSTASCFVRHR